MTQTLQRKDTGFYWMMLCSVLVHLTCYYLLIVFQFPATRPDEGPVYYVDIVNLPVAHPRAGAPSSSENTPTHAPSSQEMVVPDKQANKNAVTGKTSETRSAVNAESAKQFEERISKLKQKVAEKDFSSTMAALQKRVAAGKAGQSGIPGGKGTEAGSDYAGYIRSRLTDAFRTTIAYQTKNPEALVRLTIDRNGHVIGLRFEKKSNDRIFEDSVHRAILKAEQNFPPPPGGERFEFSYRFAPEGVSKK